MATTFHQFPRLPQEIRDMIWKAAIRPDHRGVHYFHDADKGWPQRIHLEIPLPWCSWAPVSVINLALDGGQHHSSSTYLFDSGLWTACNESRHVMQDHFAAQTKACEMENGTSQDEPGDLVDNDGSTSTGRDEDHDAAAAAVADAPEVTDGNFDEPPSSPFVQDDASGASAESDVFNGSFKGSGDYESDGDLGEKTDREGILVDSRPDYDSSGNTCAPKHSFAAFPYNDRPLASDRFAARLLAPPDGKDHLISPRVYVVHPHHDLFLFDPCVTKHLTGYIYTCDGMELAFFKQGHLQGMHHVAFDFDQSWWEQYRPTTPQKLVQLWSFGFEYLFDFLFGISDLETIWFVDRRRRRRYHVPTLSQVILEGISRPLLKFHDNDGCYFEVPNPTVDSSCSTYPDIWEWEDLPGQPDSKHDGSVFFDIVSRRIDALAAECEGGPGPDIRVLAYEPY